MARAPTTPPERVEATRGEKIMFPADGITKAQLVTYYDRVAEAALDHMRDRPISLKRFPDGIEEEGFFQKRVEDHYPGWIGRVTVRTADGRMTQPVIENSQTLAYLADQGTIEFHGSLARVRDIEKPDRLILDLDPPGGTGAGDRAKWSPLLVETALEARALFRDLGAEAFVMSSGSRGLHVMLPLDARTGFEAVAEFARDLAGRLAEAAPKDRTVEQRKAARGERLFIDWLRNHYGQTSILPYSLRALPGAPVATPLEWDELRRDYDPQRIRLTTLFRRLGQRRDPWRNAARTPANAERLAAALRAL